jgi:hypothetical protein
MFILPRPSVAMGVVLLRITIMVIPRVFRCHCLPPKFCGWAPHKSSHSFSLCVRRPLSLKQLPCLKAQITEKWLSLVQGVYCMNCCVLTNWNRATTQENLQHVFYKCPYFLVSILSYMFAFASINCEAVNLVFQSRGC